VQKNACLPDAVIQVAGYPLPNDVPRLICLDKRLIVVYIRKVSQGFPVDWELSQYQAVKLACRELTL
jgi:hypothetical protein